MIYFENTVKNQRAFSRSCDAGFPIRRSARYDVKVVFGNGIVGIQVRLSSRVSQSG